MKILSPLTFILLLLNVYIQGHEPYQANVTVNSASAHVSAPNLVDLTRDLKTTSLELLIPFYTPISPVSIDIDLRGIDALTAFQANSTTLDVEIPQLGIAESFTGATRDDSLKLFKDFIRDAGNHHELLRAYAKFSPIDPIAGNPNSLMAQMGQADYLLGHLSPLSGCDCGWNAQPIVHQFQVGTYVGRAFSHEFDTTTVTLPLRYSYSPDLHWAFILDAPITYNRNGGASSIFSSLGVGLRVPIISEWSLTPTLRFGAGGSLDLCTSGSFVLAGLVSDYHYKFFNYVFSLTNYAGYISSTNLWLTGVNFNYHLHNYIFKNGISLTTCQALCLCQRPVNFSFSFIDSYFTKDPLYIRHYDEVGFSIIINGINPYLNYDCLILGFAYQFGQKNYKGYYFNLAYQF